MSSSSQRRIVQLRSERSGKGRRHLAAWVDEAGGLHLDGRDPGPMTEMMSDNGEHEWFQTSAAADIPRLVALLGGPPGATKAAADFAHFRRLYARFQGLGPALTPS